MGYAKHIGRVGALAVTLGVGVALASPGIAYAEQPGSSSGESTTSSSTGSSDSGSPSSAGGDTTNDGSTPAATSGGGPGADDTPTVKQTTKDTRRGGGSDTHTTTRRNSGDVRTAWRLGAPRKAASNRDVADPADALSGGAAVKEETTTPAVTVVTSTAVPAVDKVPAIPSVQEPEPLKTGTVAVVAAISTAPSVETEPETPPVEAPLALAALGAVREELERNTLSRKATAAPQAAATAAITAENVLLIGVDGTNLSRVLADPANVNFFNLIKGSSTAPSSIVGHTTISNPSWSTILTGAWGERTGVINNIFTPWTYNNWPTVFNQLEQLRGDGIQTTAVANWDVIAAIAAAGGDLGADLVRYIGKREDDPNWLKTDDAVGDTTELVIANSNANVDNFVFSYFVGVDENGHAYGGASEQYKQALRNFDRNLGEILAQVTAWEADPANMNEKWTIILVTDHGHQPQVGLGHGFQSPAETETFVIVKGAGFEPRAINLQYEIVDVTPTIVTLFGGQPSRGDGTSMTELTNNVQPIPLDSDGALRDALLDVIGKNGYPGIVTNVALGVRTIFTSIPYFLVDIVDGLIGGLKSVAGQDILLVSFLAGAAVAPVRLIGDLGYVVTNFVAQIVARVTGVTGASIYPFWPPAAPDFPSYTPPSTSTPAGLQVCGGPVPGVCAAPSIAV